MSILDWFAKREFKRQEPKSRQSYPGWEQSSRIGIYFEVSPMAGEEWKSWRDLFKKEGKEVELLCYQSVKRKELAPDWTIPSYCKDERNLLGFPRSSNAKRFNAQDFDILLDLSSSEDRHHEAIFRGSKAKLKVAFHPQRRAWSDLQVNCKELKNTRACQEEILALLKFINA